MTTASSDYRNLLVLAPHVPQRVAHLADRGIGAHRVDEQRHRVVVARAALPSAGRATDAPDSRHGRALTCASRASCVSPAVSSMYRMPIDASVLATELVDADDDLLASPPPPAGSGRRSRQSPSADSRVRSPRPCRPSDRWCRSTPAPPPPGRFVSRSTKYEPPSGSTTSATPVSYAMICCVRSASVAASAVGSASASSSELVWSDCAPASTGGQRLERRPDDVVVGLLRGERHAGGLGVKPQLPRPRILGLEAVAHHTRPDPAGGAVLRDLLEEVAVGVEEEGDARRERVHVEPGVDPVLHVLDPVAQRECQLLRGRRPRLPDVVPAHRDRVPLGHVLGAERRRCR